jgi:hypothetical protein
MSSKLDDVLRDLQVTEDDMRRIRQAEERSRFLTGVVVAVVAVSSIAAGFAVGVSTPQPSYPYSGVTAVPLMAARSGARKMLLGVFLAILAFFLFFTGMWLGNPSLGVVTYYGAYSRKV